MKLKLLTRLYQCKAATRGLLFSLGFLICCDADAQNLLTNRGFESPIGTNAYGNAKGGANFPLGVAAGEEVYDPLWRSTGHWMIAYPLGGPDDFECKDRCTNVKSSTGADGNPNFWSAHFRPAHNKRAHAYYTQTVTNLTQGHSYLVKGFMLEDFWGGVGDPKRDHYLVYIEAIGGQGTPTSDGRFSVIATNNFTTWNGTSDSTIDTDGSGLAKYPTTVWRPFFAPQTPDSHGEIEIRLHLSKLSWSLTDKLELMSGYFDDLSLTP